VNTELEPVGGYYVPVDPMDGLECEGCS
jgi:hypothetical protein